MDTIVDYVNHYLWGYPSEFPWLVTLLLATGLYVTVRLMFVQLRHLGHAVKVLAGRYDDPGAPGDVSHFQALSTALSATVGIGNIAGVATAIHFGGPGALFWMWVTAFFGMALKFAECTLAVHYRSFDDKGEVVGGPMYYMERGLGPRWKPLALLFAFCAIISSFGGGNMNQANTVALSASQDLGAAPWLIGAILVVVVGVTILGGIQSIARVTSRLVPVMAIIYVMAALTVLILHVDQVPGAFGTIVTSAFNPQASLGGSVAGVWSMTLLWGVKRGLFSNEAGQGSAPIAHAAARTKEPVREGSVALLEPFIDTLLICTLTGLVIVITGVWDQKRVNTIPLAAATARLAADAERTASPGPDGVAIQVRDGIQAELVLSAVDGKVDEARVLTAEKAPFSGTLLYQPDTGALSAQGADGSAPSGLLLQGLMLRNSSALTSWAFQDGLRALGGWGNWVVTLCVFLFAVSTIISWSYYGDRCVTYLFGSRYVIIYRIVYLGFVFLGANLALNTVWALGDIALAMMCAPNLIAVALLTPKLLELSRDYFRRMGEGRGR